MLNVPTIPRLSDGGFRVWTEVRNDCATFTVLWLMRYNVERSAWVTVTQSHVDPGDTVRLDWACRGTGRFRYRAAHFEPNMMFNTYTPAVDIAG